MKISPGYPRNFGSKNGGKVGRSAAQQVRKVGTEPNGVESATS